MPAKPDDPREARDEPATPRPTRPPGFGAGSAGDDQDSPTLPQFSGEWSAEEGRTRTLGRTPTPGDSGRGAAPGPPAADDQPTPVGNGQTPPPGPAPSRPAPFNSWSELEQVVRRFAEAWQQGREPSVDDYLVGSGTRRSALLVELLQLDMEFRIDAGRPVTVQEYLGRYPELGVDAAADLVVCEYRLRRSRGTAPTVEDYLVRFPSLKTELSRRFSTGAAAAAGTDPLATRPPSGPFPVDLPPIHEVARRRKFEVIAKLGDGGMGEVWHVRHFVLGERALKLILPRYALEPELRKRMEIEARAMARIRHAHAVTIFDVCLDGVPYIEMEYIRGRTLDKILRERGPMPLDWVARILRQLCDVLQVAHEQGIVHRDLKPSNLMLLDGHPPGREHLKVLDFGIAKFVEDEPVTRYTVQGMAPGTVAYMSPEQVMSADLDARSSLGGSSDLYAVGVILYELLTGRRPFSAPFPAIFNDILNTPAPPFKARNPEVEVPPEIEQLVLRCLEKDPRKRPASAAALAEEFGRIVAPPPPPPEPPPPARLGLLSRIALLAALLTFVGIGAYGLYRALRPGSFRLQPVPPSLELHAGDTDKAISILINPDHLDPARVKVSAEAVPGIRVEEVPAPEAKAGEQRYFNLTADLNLAPRDGPIYLSFRGSDGRTESMTPVEVKVLDPILVPLPTGWVRARGEPLVRTAGRIYPKAIERAIPGVRPVVAVLVSGDREGIPFYIMKDKVWVALYRAYAREKTVEVRDQPGSDPQAPLMNVSGEEAHKFAAWLGGVLPTPEQWDRAAGLRREKPAEGPFQGGWDVARDLKGPRPIAVGLEAPLPVGQAARDISPFGCRDMSGNGQEWTRLPPGDKDAWLRAASFRSQSPYTFKSTHGAYDFSAYEDEISFRVVIEPKLGP